MKIALITSTLKGGAATSCLRLWQGFKARGYPATLLSLDADKYEIPGSAAIKPQVSPFMLREQYRQLRSRLHLRRFYRGIQASSGNVKNFHASRALPNLLLDPQVQEADVLNIHLPSNLLDFPSFLPHLPKPTIITMHDMFYFTGGCHYSYTCDRYTSACNANCPQLANAQRPALAQTGFEIKQQAYRQVKQPLHFISPSKWLKAAAQSSTLLQHFPHHHIPYGIDLAQFRPGDQAQARAALGLPQAPFLAFFMAPNLADPRKGGQYIRQLLEQSTLQQNANLEFCVAGPQKGRDAFLDLGVHNLGYLADETAVIQALQAVDVLLFPSIQDNLPNTLIEAQACGTPAIAFDIPGVNEIIQHQHNGFLAPVGDIARIHQSLEDLASQSEKLAAMAAAARKHAEHTYSLGEQAYAYERITTTMKAS